MGNVTLNKVAKGDTASTAITGLTDSIIHDNGTSVGIGTTSPLATLHNNGELITKGPWHDVRAYGAKGDGTTDDTAAIQAAIDNVHQYNGGIVFLPSGTYKISSSDGVSCLYIGKYPTVDGRGVQLIGTGALSTILKIDNSATGVVAITIQQSSSSGTVDVVIKDLQITIASNQDDLHTGINNLVGFAAFFENVIISGASGTSNRIKYGIISSAWGPNLYNFCAINSFSTIGIWLKNDSSEVNSDPNATQINNCTFNGSVFTSLNHNVYGIKVDSGTASRISGCTWNSNPSPSTLYKVIDIYLGGNSQQTVVTNNYHEGADIGLKIECCGNTVSGNWYSIGDEFLQITSGYEEGNIVVGSRNNNTGSTDPAIFHSEMADIANSSALGSESLQNGGFSDWSYWTTSQRITFTGGAALFSQDSVSSANLIQTKSNMAVSGVGNRWYKLVYTIGTPGTTGSINSGSNNLILANAIDFQNGQPICLKGAGASGADLVTTIACGGGTVALTLTASASTKVINAAVLHYPGTIGSIINGSNSLTIADAVDFQNGQGICIKGAGASGTDLVTAVVSVTLQTSGSINSGSYTLTIANAIDFQNGQGIVVKGAGASGADLVTTISSGGGTTTLTLAASASTTVTNVPVLHSPGNTITLKDSASTTVTNTSVLHYPGTIGSINSGTNTLTLVSSIDFQNGQAICVKGAGASGADLVTTISSGGGTTTLTLAASASTTATNTLVLHYPGTTGNINSGSNTLTIYSAIGFQNGQGISVKGAGASGADLVTTISSGGGTTTLTLAASASTAVTNAPVLHYPGTTGNINSGSYALTIANALDFQNGQGICVKGAGASGADLVTTISSGGGTTNLTLAASASTTVTSAAVLHYLGTKGGINSGSTSLTLTNALDFQNGQGISVKGAGASGADLVTTISSGGGTTTLTLAASASTTVTNVPVLHHDYSVSSVGIVGGFATSDTYLNVTYGTHVLYFKTSANPGDFTLWSPPGFRNLTLDYLSLKEIQGGDWIVHGKLGVGLGSPGKKIDVMVNSDGDGIRLQGTTTPSATSPGFSLYDASGSANRGALGLAESGGRWSNSAYTGDIVLRADTGKLHLQTGTGDASMTISGGAVGIGTAFPGSKLQVNGNAAIGYSASTAGPSMGLAVSGAVGIGVTNPGEKLEVEGKIKLGTGSYKANIEVGNGVPSHTAPKGTLYINTAASSSTTRLYINKTGSNTWASIAASS